VWREPARPGSASPPGRDDAPTAGPVRARLRAEELDIEHPLAAVSGESLGALLHTDLMADVLVSERHALVPQTAYGVYAVRTLVGGRTIDGVAAIGVRPTFGNGPVSIEVFLFDYDGNLYGKHLEVSFVKRLRGEQKFPDADALVKQMHRDVDDAKSALAART